MRKFKQLIYILGGLVLLTSCQTNDLDQIKRSIQVEPLALVEEVSEMTHVEVAVTIPTTNNSLVSGSNFSVITVGTGTPKFSETQSSSSTLIQYKGGYYLVDFFNGIYLDDLLYRKMNIKDVDESYKETMLNYAHTEEIIDTGRLTIDGLDIQAGEMAHTMYNLAYRFEAEGQSIVVSGDVSYDENLIEFAKDADILVIDGTFYKGKENTNEGRRKYIEPFYAYGGDVEAVPHLTFDEMVRVAVESNVATLVVTHYNSADQDRIDQSILKIKECFDGEVIYATDMLEVGIRTE